MHQARAVIVGYLALATPAMAAIVLVPFFCLRMFGPFLFVPYVLAGIAFGWQWYSLALPSWKRWLLRKGVQDEDVEQIAHRAGLGWPVEAPLGPFAFHTTAATVCGVHFGPWLLSSWFIWILPLAGIGNGTATGNDYLRHFELASVVPAFGLGYMLSLYFPRLAIWAWVVPTIILLFKLLTFTDASASVLFSNPWSRFSYFFVIERSMPIFVPGSGGLAPGFRGDPLRVAQQMFVVAPFYAGLAYSIGALAARRNLLKRLFEHFPTMQLEPEITRTESNPNGRIEDEAETRP
jgi:hypothetical protein